MEKKWKQLKSLLFKLIHKKYINKLKFVKLRSISIDSGIEEKKNQTDQMMKQLNLLFSSTQTN